MPPSPTRVYLVSLRWAYQSGHAITTEVIASPR